MAKLSTKEKLAIATKALENISTPITYLRDEAEMDGVQLNGVMAIQIANDPSFLKGLAEKALSKINNHE